MNIISLNKLNHDELLTLFNDDSKIIELLKENVNDHRFKHSLSVADTAKMLAKYHGVDQNKAYKAGLLHDLCKSVSNEKMLEVINKYEPNKSNYPLGTLHGYVCYYLLKELNVLDEDILDSIYNHTILERKSPLNIIIFIADKREPLRNIDDDILSIAKDDLMEAYRLLIDDVKEYLIGRNEQPFKSNY